MTSTAAKMILCWLWGAVTVAVWFIPFVAPRGPNWDKWFILPVLASVALLLSLICVLADAIKGDNP